eukprot:gene4639-14835_t
MGRKTRASKANAASGEPETECWSSKDEKVRVTESDGFDISLTAKLDCPPDMVYTILTDKDPTTIFKNLMQVLYRRTLHDDGQGKRHLAVGQRALAKFLFLNFTFDTDLFIVEDAPQRKGKRHLATCSGRVSSRVYGNLLWPNLRQPALAEFLFLHFTFDTDLFIVGDAPQRKIKFEVKDDGRGAMRVSKGDWHIEPSSDSAMIKFEVKDDGRGAMKVFNGNWHIQPFSDNAMATIRTQSTAPVNTTLSKSTWLTNTSSLFKNLNLKPASQEESLVTLEQRVVPRNRPPPGIKHLIRRLCAKQIQDMMKDVRLEVARRKALISSEDAKGKGSVASSAASVSLAFPLNVWAFAKPINLV